MGSHPAPFATLPPPRPFTPPNKICSTQEQALMPPRVLVVNARSPLAFPLVPKANHPSMEMCTTPPPSPGPTKQEIVVATDQWILEQAADTTSGTPFTSAFNLRLAFAACFNSDIPSWGRISYQVVLYGALYHAGKSPFFRPLPNEYQSMAWSAATPAATTTTEVPYIPVREWE